MLNLLPNQNNALPILPALPVAGGGISFSSNHEISSILDNERLCFVSSGSVAIALALKEQNISKGDEVLVPAYHCPTMIEPIAAVDATPIFYEINKDLSIDLEDIKNKISDKTKAILVTHLFGVKQNINQLRRSSELLSKVCVIEDCAHTFFQQEQNSLVEGDYMIGSLTKFFPTHDGGVLVAKKEIKNVPISLSTTQEIKSLYNIFHVAVQYGRFKWLAWLFALMSLLRNRKTEDDLEVARSHTDAATCSEIEIYAASKSCEFVVDHANFKRIVEKRRQNYFYILDSLKNVKNLDLSLNCTENAFIPYMVIGVLQQPALHHPLLINKKLPIWRWEHLFSSQCQNANAYSKSLIQIPCHQQLSSKELLTMVDGIKECLSEE